MVLSFAGVAQAQEAERPQRAAQQASEEEQAREIEARVREEEQARLGQERSGREAVQEAQRRLEEARRDLERAAREVAELSAGAVRPMMRTFTRAMPFGRGGAVLGVVIEDADPGVRVTGVTPGGAAAEAGVVVGDVIAAIDDVELAGAGSESERLVEHMASVEPGQNVSLRLLRNGQTQEVDVTVNENEDFFAYTGAFGGGMPATPGVRVVADERGFGIGPNILRLQRFLDSRWDGLELVALTDELGSYFDTSEGLLVVRAPEDDDIGLRDGDVILEIGGREPTSPAHAMRILMSFEPGETLQLAIMRERRRETLEYEIPEESVEG
jgi:S1-C subfamily serine protease